MDATAEGTTVVREIAIAARPETIWELLVDPEQAVKWMGMAASFDLRQGGIYRLDVIPGHTARGEFVEIDPPHRLVHTFGWEPESGSVVAAASTTVEYELIPDGEGTTLRFTHRDLPSAEAMASHAHGWEHYLARLAAVAVGRDPGVDPWQSGVMT